MFFSFCYKVEYLAGCTRNMPFKMKDESSGQTLKLLIAPSAKQHVVLTMGDNAMFPVPTSEPKILCKKVKGK